MAFTSTQFWGLRQIEPRPALGPRPNHPQTHVYGGAVPTPTATPGPTPTPDPSRTVTVTATAVVPPPAAVPNPGPTKVSAADANTMRTVNNKIDADAAQAAATQKAAPAPTFDEFPNKAVPDTTANTGPTAGANLPGWVIPAAAILLIFILIFHHGGAKTVIQFARRR